MITERQHDDRTAAIGAWKAYSNEERKNALRELDEKLALKGVAKETAIVNTALAPSSPLDRLSATIKLRSIKERALQIQFLRKPLLDSASLKHETGYTFPSNLSSALRMSKIPKLLQHM